MSVIKRCLVLLCCLFPLTTIATGFSVNVMAPLLIDEHERPAFIRQLQQAKALGVDAVSVDIWWGLVEASADQQFNWQYYDAIFADIRQAGLNIVPIMAFHQCGGNVGDDCDIPLPAWIWQHYTAQGLKETDLQYLSEYGQYSKETVSLWADELVLMQYREFMQAFATRYAELAPHFAEINISMGPAGELRYPSYNSHDQGKTAYPSRGGFQAYSRLAVADFEAQMAERYQNLAALNVAWHTRYSSFSEVQPPADAEQFMQSGAIYHSQYGRDFSLWYQQALLKHGKRMLAAALTSFGGALAQVELGYKIPGIHWQMANAMPLSRSAELAAGLISSAEAFTKENGYGYRDIVAVAAEQSGRVVLHFTALEMADQPKAPAYSLAATLVNWVGAESARQGVRLKGENALAGGLAGKEGWRRISAALKRGQYSGLTLLRLTDVTQGGVAQQQLAQLICQQKNTGCLNTANASGGESDRRE